MSSLKHRLLTTLIGVPSLLIIVFLLPQFGHLAFALLVMVFSILGSREIYRIVKAKYKVTPNLPYVTVGLIPIAAWASSITPYKNLTELTLIFLLMLSFALEIIDGAKKEEPFSDSLLTISFDSFSLIYPSYLLSFIIKINSFEKVSAFYALFLLCVFSNDIFAYVFGMLFGKNSRGFIKASPNKSVVGFVGGFLSCVAISIASTYLFKIPLNLVQTIIIGISLSLSANIGDLIESVIKRSSQVKDSGTLIPGRGGALDNLDSLLASAPLFYLLLEIFI